MQLSQSEIRVLRLLSETSMNIKQLLKSVDESNLAKLEKYRLVFRNNNTYHITQLGLRELALVGI